MDGYSQGFASPREFLTRFSSPFSVINLALAFQDGSKILDDTPSCLAYDDIRVAAHTLNCIRQLNTPR